MRIVRSVPDEVQLVGPVDGHAHMLLVETFDSSYYLDGSPAHRSGMPSGVFDAGFALPRYSSIPGRVQVCCVSQTLSNIDPIGPLGDVPTFVYSLSLIRPTVSLVAPIPDHVDPALRVNGNRWNSLVSAVSPSLSTRFTQRWRVNNSSW